MVYAADLFGDLDLAAAACTARRVAAYPEGLLDAIAEFPSAPVCYTGALENHPHVLGAIPARRQLAGNGPDALALVRDPVLLADLLRANRLRFPDTRSEPNGVPVDGSFLRKPVASAGGRGIAIWRGGDDSSPAGWLWQRRIVGEPVAAVLALQGGEGRLLGVSRQLVGEPWCRARPFAYCGSVQWPLDLAPDTVRADFDALAAALARDAGLGGIVGVDGIVEADGHLTVIEVNPRPTASAELVERATGTSILATHLAAFGLRSPGHGPVGTAAAWAKAVLFTDRPLPIDAATIAGLAAVARAWSAADGWPALADIPRPGQVLPRGAPVVTVFACGFTPAAAEAELRRRVAAVSPPA